MGINRIVNTDFWNDEKVENFTPEEKYFWLYLLTNPYTKQLGIYKITMRQIAFQTGYEIDTISKLISRFQNEYKLIKYVDSEIAIKNALKYNVIKGGKPVEDCLKSDIKNVKNKNLIKWVFSSIDVNDDINATVKKVIIDYKESTKEIYDNDNDNDNDSIVDVSSTNRKNTKHKHGEYSNVLLTDDELEKLKKEFPNDYQERIERVSEYCASTGKTYKNYLATIRNWNRRDQDKKPKAEVFEEKELW